MGFSRMIFKFLRAKRFTRAEFCEHNTQNSAWVLVDNKIYDVTDLISTHSGGVKTILAYAGKDVTHHVRFHSKNMMNMLKPRFVGYLLE